MSIQPYNITLPEGSGVYQYAPVRDGPPNLSWNSTYTGNTQWWGNSGGLGQAFRQTELSGAGFSLDFDGTAVYLCLSQNGQAGYTLMVDGHASTKTAPVSDAACSGFPVSTILAVADGLTYGSHTALVNATIAAAGDSLDFYGGVVTLSAGPPGTIVAESPTLIDDRNPGWLYEPVPWTQDGSGPEYNGTRSYACGYTSKWTASIEFNGTSVIQLFGFFVTNTFGYSIQFNNRLTTYSSTDYFGLFRQTMFFAGGLDPTQTYVLELFNYDPQQPNGPPGLNGTTPFCTNLDALLLTQVTLPTTSTSTSSSGTNTNTAGGASQSAAASTGGSSSGNSLSGGDIAGIVIGVVAAVILAGISVWLLLRLRKRAIHSSLEPPVAGSSWLPGSATYPAEPTPFISPTFDTAANGRTASLSGGTGSSVSDNRSKAPLRNNSGDAVPILSATQAPLSESGTMMRGGQRMTQSMLQNAPTVDLVTILNQRLRQEQADNVEEPPVYE